MRAVSRSSIIALVLPALSLAWTGCSKTEEKEELVPEVSFSFDLPALPVSIDSAEVAGPFGMMLELDSAALADALAANNYVPSQLTGMTFTKARLYGSTPVNGVFNHVASVKVQLGVDVSPPVTVASLAPVPNGSQTLLLGLSGVDVLQLVRSGQARIVLRMAFDGPVPPQSTHLLVLGARANVGL
ncbi:MAG: hypothetical protein M9900_07395 [Flavobacteriales bacterium]|nr:hypothetical protein [Flavobacteriales bacterium]